MRKTVAWPAVFLWICVEALLFSPAILLAQAPTESGKFRLHEFEQAVGEESFTITRDANALTLTDDFKFTDRYPETLHAIVRTSTSYVPERYAITGRLDSDIDTEIIVRGNRATARVGKATQPIPVAPVFFTISGSAPAAVQMVMMRYWLSHGSPEHMPTLPEGNVTIRDRGSEIMRISGRLVRLERYIIEGLFWGMETLWMDRNNNLVAVVSMVDFSQFEAIREEYVPALSVFVRSAASDEMAVLSQAGRALLGRRAGSFAFIGATVIDVTGKPPIEHATIVTRNGRIVAVGPSETVQIPPAVERIDVQGKYIIPGLWDMHAHYEQVEWGPIYVAAGVTTVRDVGSAFDFITQVRDHLDRGSGIGPHMLLAGIVDGDPATRAIGMARVNSAEDAQTWVKRYHDAGFEQIKIYSSVRPGNVKAVCEDAHRLGMTVTGHIPDGMDAYQAVDDGMDMINHIDYVSYLLLPGGFDRDKVQGAERMKVFAAIDVNSEAARRAIEFFKRHGTVIDPTVALLELKVRPASVPESKIENGFARLPPELQKDVASGGIPDDLAPLANQIFQRALEIIAALHRGGVPVVAGTDQAVPGYSLYREIELYQRAGFTPMEALQAATIVPARAMKLDAESGSIEVGKRADFDVLEANPLDDIHNIRTVRMVLVNGILYDPRPLWEMVRFKPE